MRLARLLCSALLLLAPHAARAQTDPVGPATIDACIGRAGYLRLARGGCRSFEEPLSWQRGGGVWVHDADGRPLGRSMGREPGDFWLFLDRNGFRLRLSLATGAADAVSSTIWFAAPDCQGPAYASSGHVFGELVASHFAHPRQFFATEPVTAPVTLVSRLASFQCQNLATPVLRDDLRETVPLDASVLGFELPVPLPLRFGAGPLSDGGPELIHACVGVRGQLRIPSGGVCRRFEQPIRWQRVGGLRVYDGNGVDLGAPIGTSVSGTQGILLTDDGAWIEPDPFTGALEQPRRLYPAPGCQGEPFIPPSSIFPRPAGQVFADFAPGSFLIVTSERVEDGSFASSRGPTGACVDGAGLADGLRLAPYLGRLPVLPVATPIVVGFPGSPIANPQGPAVPPELLHACAGSFVLRRVAEGEACGFYERALRWPQRGGLRALDALGNELGAYLERPTSPTVEETMRLIDDTSGLRFGVRLFDGVLADDLLGASVPVEISFTTPVCSGTAFRALEAMIGFVFPDAGLFPDPRVRLWVGTHLDTLVPGSVRIGFSCTAPFIDEPVPSTVVVPFRGVVPFPLPVETPLLVGPGN